nr:substrate-binding domain-containing protein [Rhodococcus opacus]
MLSLGTVPPTEQLLATARSMPTVVASGREPDLPCVDVVTGDDRVGAAPGRRAPDRERTHPHRPPRRNRARRELRADGYSEQMRRHGLDEHIHIEVSDRSEEGDVRAAQALILSTPRPTAILANSDYAALITMSHAESTELTVPADLSVVGYDNSYLARTGYIGLTSVDNNYVEMGRLAVQRLIAHRGPRRPSHRQRPRPHLAPPQDVRTALALKRLVEGAACQDFSFW